MVSIISHDRHTERRHEQLFDESLLDIQEKTGVQYQLIQRLVEVYDRRELNGMSLSRIDVCPYHRSGYLLLMECFYVAGVDYGASILVGRKMGMAQEEGS